MHREWAIGDRSRILAKKPARTKGKGYIDGSSGTHCICFGHAMVTFA
jgi:hypothetical protein